ncbi:hypothetical protein BV25DRAFT_1831469 [Artomyces pyxidatus]|uniref:Uncharacterized protein n=1 Tax=Artomyces pyxidatus TaxID=48021 RepID=A0ACB8SKY4_9AGAM|nr:hypothetical protein BV25DRAFT_1831469 [Artomyces pyxidatus]
MRPSLPRLVRILPRTAVTPTSGRPRPRIYDELPKEARQITPLIDVLQKRKQEAGAAYPPNIRIEPVISKRTFRGLKGEAIAPLRQVLRER